MQITCTNPMLLKIFYFCTFLLTLKYPRTNHTTPSQFHSIELRRKQYWIHCRVLTSRPKALVVSMLSGITESKVTFLVYMHRLGVLPGTGIPAFVSLMKYFWTLLATCNVATGTWLLMISNWRQAAWSISSHATVWSCYLSGALAFWYR